jgi:hypothetical protein
MVYHGIGNCNCNDCCRMGPQGSGGAYRGYSCCFNMCSWLYYRSQYYVCTFSDAACTNQVKSPLHDRRTETEGYPEFVKLFSVTGLGGIAANPGCYRTGGGGAIANGMYWRSATMHSTSGLNHAQPYEATTCPIEPNLTEDHGIGNFRHYYWACFRDVDVPAGSDNQWGSFFTLEDKPTMTSLVGFGSRPFASDFDIHDRCDGASEDTEVITEVSPGFLWTKTVSKKSVSVYNNNCCADLSANPSASLGGDYPACGASESLGDPFGEGNCPCVLKKSDNKCGYCPWSYNALTECLDLP